MILGKPLFIWFGLLAAVCLVITLLGGLMHKPIRYHRAAGEFFVYQAGKLCI